MNLEDLKNVKTIITHDSCPDGRASALILHDALPDAEIVFVQYQTPAHKALEPKSGMLFCDFTPYVERDKDGVFTPDGARTLKAWVDAGTIVLDHHKGAHDIVAAFGRNGVFADEVKEPGKSGATLAYIEVWSMIELRRGATKKDPDKGVGEKLMAISGQGGDGIFLARHDRVGQFAALAGVRDTWQKNDPRWSEACAQSAALMFWPWEKLLQAGVHNVKPMMEIGPVLLERDYERDTKTMREAHRFEVKDTKTGDDGGRLVVLCFEGTHTSDIADRAEADLVVGWHYLVEGGEQKIVFSTRSRGSFSCLDFVKAYGGGGHKNAAGFKLSVKSDAAVSAQDYSPYEIVEKLVHSYLSTR